MYFLHSLLVAAKNDPEGEAAQLMRVFTFVVVPTINPDGYEYSRDHSRLWRKNRQYTGSDLCQGEPRCRSKDWQLTPDRHRPELELGVQVAPFPVRWGLLR